MFSRTFVRASKSEGPRRRMRQERTEERRIALQNRWYVGGLAAIVASSLVFSGMSPASAEEVTTPDPAATTEATTTDPTSTDAAILPPADEPAAEHPAVEEPAAPAEAPPGSPETSESEAAPFSALAAPLAETDIAALALACAGWPVAGSPVAGFEIDGNLCLDGAGIKDWATVGGQPVASDGFDDATQFDQGASESNWPWSVNQTDGSGVATGQSDIGNVYAYTQTVNGNVFAYLGFERDATTGTIGYYVELNKKANLHGPVPDRSVGDLRLTIEQNGNVTIFLVGADTWDGTKWVPIGSLAGFVGQTAQGDIDNLTGQILKLGSFAEAAINLTALFGNAGCSGAYGVLNVRSNSSAGNENSSMKDWIKPVSLNVPSTCATLKILKTDMAGNPLAGADFEISPDPTDGVGVFTGTTNASGEIVISGVEPGTYSVKETKAPAGYILDSTPQSVTLGTAETKTLTFKDPLGSGAWVKRAGDANGPLLGGATFSLAAIGGPAAAAPWAASFPKTVVDNGANDADPVAGQIKVLNLPIGNYSVTETAAPAGYVLDSAAKTFAVTQAAPNGTISTPFINIPYATVTLTKDWVNSFDGDKADLAIGGAATKTGTSTAPTDGPVISVSVAPGSSLNLSEVLNAQNRGLYGSVLSCVGASVSNNTGLTGSITVPAYPASANGVQCTFTNTAKTREVKLQKQWVDAFQGDSAQLSLTGDADGAKSIASGAAGSQLDSVNVATATVRVGETVQFGEALATLSGAQYSTTFSCTPTVSVTPGATVYAYTLDRMPDQNVTCTFKNETAKATVTLKKSWVNAFEDDIAKLKIDGAKTSTADAVAPEGTGTSSQFAQVVVRIGDKLTLSEELPTSNDGRYTATWDCAHDTQITVTGNMVCTVTNTAKTIDVAVNKVWKDAFAADTASLSINGQAATATADGTATQTIPNVVVKTVRVGEAVTVKEVLGQNKGTYDTTAACTTVGEQLSADQRTATFTAAEGPNVSCTFTNTARKHDVTVKKAWADAITGDKADLTIAAGQGGKLFGGTPSNTSTVTAQTGPTFTDNAHTATTQVRVGDSVTLSEVITGSGTYSTVYECTDGAKGTLRSFDLKVLDANVTCTFTNTANRAAVTLKKNWVGAFEGDEAHLSITGAASDSDTSVASGADGIDDTFSQVSVRLGEKVTLKETITDADNTGRYDSSWTCDNQTSGGGRTIGEVTVTGDVVCTITNTAKKIDITVAKQWQNAFVGDSAKLSIGATENVSSAASPNELDANVVTKTVRVGEAVHIAEALDDAVNTGRYASIYACQGVDAAGTGRALDFVAPGANVVCTFTNTAIKVPVLLSKRWIDALPGDSTTLSITPESGPILDAVSNYLQASPKDFDDTTHVVKADVRIGSVIPMKEVVTGAGVYASTSVCTGGEKTPVGTDGRAFTLKVTGDGIWCRFVNQSQTATVHLLKTWVNGQEGDTAKLDITAQTSDTATSTSNGAVGAFTDVENEATAEGLIGAQVTVKETVSVLKGAASDYISSLVCKTADEKEVYSADGRTGSFTMPNEPVWCEFTNTAELPTLSLVKVVSGAEVADTNWQLRGAAADGSVVTNPAGGDVPPTDVPTDVPFELSESLRVAFPGSGEFSAGRWSCINEEGTVALTDSVAGSADLRGLDKGEDVVCTIVNTHVDQGFEFDKSAAGSVQRPDGTWDVTYEITVHNNSVLVPIEYDLSDTLAEPADGVRYLDASWTGPTEGDFDLEESLTADLATGEDLPPFDQGNDNDAVYTVVVHVAVDKIPAVPGPCPEAGGIGIVNAATVTVGEDSDTDTACGTVHFDDVKIVKTASSLPPQGSVEPGTEFTYVLTVTNLGTRAAENLVVTDAVPARLQVTEVDVPTGWQNDNGDAIVGPGNTVKVSTTMGTTLAKGASVEIVLTVKVTPTPAPLVGPGDGTVQPPAPLENLSNTACVAAKRDQVAANNCSTVEIPVREITAVVYTKCVADAPFLGWTVRKSGTLLGNEIDFLWTPDNGDDTTVPPDVAITQPGGTATWSDEIEWPGTAFTPSGVSIDYPGWRPIQASDIVPGTSPTQYYYPGTDEIITAEDMPFYVFNGLILDDSELDYAWREPSTVTFTVNPELVFAVEYPDATPECAVARHSNVQIEKTASVEKTDPGASFTYSLAVQNVSDDSAAEAVVVTDAIPADLKITDVTWPGKGDNAVFPNWLSCAVTGQNGSGYGGTLTCALFGPLQPQGANEGASAAPTITLAATVNPSSKASSITNVAVVDYHTFGNPDDKGRDSDDAVVLLSALPATGGELPPLLVVLGLFALLGGTTMLIVTRRRRGEAKPTV